ncbi:MULTISPECIES: MbtH family protein [Variovorax]|jgi:MbtH protein|uniref:MbtH family protein n=1 Tax=Variovorax TaxID=34072 RepID=UPI00089A9096|nr:MULTISPECIES: MbtH family protein [unclassified Variovorax]SDX77771.1 MbtH protein [Variovorax sp. YR634]SDY95875.1 MbtH protein [Variovorax sp. YR266]SET36510.1 MbtH protein [Variovorax sp. OV084]
MSNPFDDKNATFLVLVNEEGQHSLWPSFIEVPAGWQVALAATDRAACSAFIEANWTDMRPRSLAAMDLDAAKA